MAKFIFIIDQEDNRECSRIEFDVPDDLDIWEYKRVCERMAAAMGFHHNSIKTAFQKEEPISEEDKAFKKLFTLKNEVTGSFLSII